MKDNTMFDIAAAPAGISAFFYLALLITGLFRSFDKKILSNKRLVVYFSLICATCIIRILYFLVLCVTDFTSSRSATSWIYFLWWLPQTLVIVVYISYAYFWLDATSANHRLFLFANSALQKKALIAEVFFLFILLFGNWVIYFFTIQPFSSSSHMENVDKYVLASTQLFLSLFGLVIICSFIRFLWTQPEFRHPIRSYKVLHFTFGVWIFGLFFQSTIILTSLTTDWDIKYFKDNYWIIMALLFFFSEWFPLFLSVEARVIQLLKFYKFEEKLSPHSTIQGEQQHLLNNVTKKISKIIPTSDLYMTDHKLGEGAAGVVFKGIYEGEEVAVKFIRYTDLETSSLDDFCNEVETLGAICHPNIVRFIGACVEFPHVSIITEYIPMGSLRNILDKGSNEIPKDRYVSIAKDVARAMKYLHMMGIIHRDLKSDNLLVDKGWRIKVTDFGMCKILKSSKNSLMSGDIGTLAWVAPEVLLPDVKTYTEKIDVYSYGIVLWEMITSDRPYEHVDIGLRQLVISGHRPPMPQNTSLFWRVLITNCWQHDPEKRPSFPDIVRYLNEGIELDGNRSEEEEHMSPPPSRARFSWALFP